MDPKPAAANTTASAAPGTEVVRTVQDSVSRWRDALRRRLAAQAGQTLAEYALVLSLVACAATGLSVVTFRDSITDAFAGATGCIMGTCEEPPAQQASQDEADDEGDDEEQAAAVDEDDSDDPQEAAPSPDEAAPDAGPQGPSSPGQPAASSDDTGADEGDEAGSAGAGGRSTGRDAHCSDGRGRDGERSSSCR